MTDRLSSNFFSSGDTLSLAPHLLGKLLVHQVNGQRLAGYITEVEVYLPDDPASHCFRGPTPRNQAMYGPPGTIYAYRSYGIHTCLNIIASPKGTGGGILIRAIQPTQGVEIMKQNRQTDNSKILTNGPGKLTQALAVTMDLYGQSIFTSNLWLENGLSVNPDQIKQTPRIGISRAKELPYRFLLESNS